MIDTQQLVTPTCDGGVLVLPPAEAWAQVACDNQAALDKSGAILLGRPLSHWRNQVRESLMGRGDLPLIVTGHQPGFIHPGVWAKHVAVSRAAVSIGGRAINLVVDSDASGRMVLPVPTVTDGRISLHDIPLAAPQIGHAYEEVAGADPSRLAAFASEVCRAMGDRYDHSLMPVFMGAMLDAQPGSGLVGQITAGRRAVEHQLDIAPLDLPISTAWPGPLLAEMLLCAERFHTCYNEALEDYRAAAGLRGRSRPMPSLAKDADRWELPVWAYRPGQRRKRLFVVSGEDDVLLLAAEEVVGRLPRADLPSCDNVKALLGDLGNWRLRPRALALTMWARLLFADLFVHGVGGAVYERIGDRLIQRYFDVDPPAIACVSATLRLDLPDEGVEAPDVSHLAHQLRDCVWNPHRHISPTPPARQLIARRGEVLARASRLRRQGGGDRRTRRAAFEELRAINQALGALEPEVQQAAKRRLEAARAARARTILARRRDYFFALFTQGQLERLLALLPSVEDFSA